jgi:hypothetical protein
MAAGKVVFTKDSTEYQQLFTAILLQEGTEHLRTQQVCTIAVLQLAAKLDRAA